jgi:hypothetical protein
VYPAAEGDLGIAQQDVGQPLDLVGPRAEILDQAFAVLAEIGRLAAQRLDQVGAEGLGVAVAGIETVPGRFDPLLVQEAGDQARLAVPRAGDDHGGGAPVEIAREPAVQPLAREMARVERRREQLRAQERPDVQFHCQASSPA